MLRRESKRTVRESSGTGIRRIRGVMVWVLAALLSGAIAGGAAAAGSGFARTLSREQLNKDYAALADGDAAWKTLVAGAWSMGYSPTTRWWNPSWGEDAIWDTPGGSVTLRWRVFDLDNIGSPDAGALFYVTDGVRAYRGLVVAKNKDPLDILEYVVTGLAGNYKMVEGSGFWTCAENAMRTQCGSVGSEVLKNCVAGATLVTGDFSWSAYMKGLVSSAFGSCALQQASVCLGSKPRSP